jgi:hypothetical protein
MEVHETTRNNMEASCYSGLDGYSLADWLTPGVPREDTHRWWHLENIYTYIYIYI